MFLSSQKKRERHDGASEKGATTAREKFMNFSYDNHNTAKWYCNAFERNKCDCDCEKGERENYFC